jgi:putative salt-induced outer membrane protein YdiY
MKHCVLFFLGAALLFGDEVLLKNKDRISGRILKFDDKELTIQTQFAGDIRIKREGIQSISTDEVVQVSTKTGEKRTAKVTPTENPSDLKVFRTPAEQEAYENAQRRSRRPRFDELWAGSFDLGYAQARGNADTNTISSALRASRATQRGTLKGNFTSLYSSNRTSGKSLLTANAIRGGIKYDGNFTPKWYTFASQDFEFDQFQGLDLRLVPSGGLGLHGVNKKDSKWDIFAGASVNRESFNTGLQRVSAELLAGNELNHRLSPIFTLQEKLVFYNNITQSGNFRLNADVSLGAALLKWMSWQFTTSNRYLSNPLPGRQTNDILVTTGVRLSFSR